MLCDVCVLSFSGNPATAALRLAERLGISEAEATQIVRSAPVVVKRCVEPAVAREMERQLRAIGAEVLVQGTASEIVPKQTSPRASPLQELPPSSVGAPRHQQRAPSNQTDGGQRSRLIVPASLLALAGTLIAALLLYSSQRAPPPSQPVVRPTARLTLHTRGRGGSGDPVVILLHGYRAPAKDMLPLGERVLKLGSMQNARVIAPEGILSFGNGRHAWFDNPQELAESRRQVSALIDDLVDEGTPANRIVLGGFSQGAMLAVDVGLRHRPRIFGVAMLAGGYIRDVDWKPVLTDLGDTRFLVAHGRQDRVLPFWAAREIASKLTAAGAPVTWIPFDGGHEIPADVRREVAQFCASTVAAD